MARIYVSSTFGDLKEYRAQVLQALRRLGHDDVAMEYYGATDERPLDKCLNDIASCDLYLGIFAWRYGYIPPEQDKSITELEYRRAVETGKTCLIFILAEDAPWPGNKFEAVDRIRAFRSELSTNHIVDFFASEQNLVALVSQAVANWQNKVAGSDSGQRTFLQFETRYRDLVVQRHKFITPPNYQSEQHRIPFNELYVAPHLTPVNHDKNPGKPLSIADFIASIQHTVVLGNPGAGKSTLAEKVCFDLSSRYGEALRGDNPMSPVLVIVREFGAEKKKSSCSIVEFIELKSRSDYQIDPPEGAFEYLLSQGKLLVIFDGLDELIDTSYRQTITHDIEAFCHRYPLVSVLVTSRETGYLQAPLDKQIFNLYQIASFDANQVKDYVEKWFRFEAGRFQEDQTKKAGLFLTELASVPDEIKCNALLLSLICNIYRGEGYIPRNRPDIYEKCTDLLFEKRDRERQIVVDLAIREHIRPTMSYLAYWIYGDVDLQSGVKESKLVEKTAEYLLKVRFENRDEADSAAHGFIEFCTGRAWVFTDIGTTLDDERLYQFTHRTFLEYFTALYLLREHREPQSLLTVLIPKLEKQEWVVIAELAFQRMARSSDGEADLLLAALVNKTESAPIEESINLLMFSANCLSFMVPKESTVRKIVLASLDLGIQIAVRAIEEQGIEEIYAVHPFFEHNTYLSAVLRRLLRTDNENSETVHAVMETALLSLIKADNDERALVASEIALSLSSIIERRERSDPLNKIPQQLNHLSEKIIESCVDELIALCPKYARCALDMYAWNRIRLEQLVKWHGTQILFEQHYYVAWAHLYDLEIVMDLLDICDRDVSESLQNDLLDKLRQVGEVLPAYPTPWASFSYGALDNISMVTTCWSKVPELAGTTLFGIFLCLAFLYERWYDRHGVFESRDEHKTLLPDYLYWVFLTRLGLAYEEDDDTRLEEELDRGRFSPAQREFIYKWASERISIMRYQ